MTTLDLVSTEGPKQAQAQRHIDALVAATEFFTEEGIALSVKPVVKGNGSKIKYSIELRKFAESKTS